MQIEVGSMSHERKTKSQLLELVQELEESLASRKSFGYVEIPQPDGTCSAVYERKDIEEMSNELKKLRSDNKEYELRLNEYKDQSGYLMVNVGNLATTIKATKFTKDDIREMLDKIQMQDQERIELIGDLNKEKDLRGVTLLENMNLVLEVGTAKNKADENLIKYLDVAHALLKSFTGRLFLLFNPNLIKGSLEYPSQTKETHEE